MPRGELRAEAATNRGREDARRVLGMSMEQHRKVRAQDVRDFHLHGERAKKRRHMKEALGENPFKKAIRYNI